MSPRRRRGRENYQTMETKSSDETRIPGRGTLNTRASVVVKKGCLRKVSMLEMGIPRVGGIQIIGNKEEKVWEL